MSRQGFGKSVSGSPAAGAAGTMPQASKPAATAGRPASSVEAKPNVDAVRRRAYEIFMERTAKGAAGDAAGDWAKAERELVKK